MRASVVVLAVVLLVLMVLMVLLVLVLVLMVMVMVMVLLVFVNIDMMATTIRIGIIIGVGVGVGVGGVGGGFDLHAASGCYATATPLLRHCYATATPLPPWLTCCRSGMSTNAVATHSTISNGKTSLAVRAALSALISWLRPLVLWLPIVPINQFTHSLTS